MALNQHFTQKLQEELQQIEETTYQNLKREHTTKMWDSLKKLKVFSQKYKYHSAWTYEDVLNYFKKNGFPKPAKSVVDTTMEGMNVCKARHILRNDCLCEEPVLLALLEMYERKKEIERIEKEKKFWKAFITIFSFILSVAMAFIPAGQGVAVWLQVMSYIGIAASIASGIVGIVDMALSANNEDKIKEVTKKTQDLILKNMPESGNFVDTSITDPYAMYANGRYWKEGGAGMERYDQIKPHQPYNALDDKFKDSDMYDILNYKLDKNAGGQQYYSNLYPDAKWTNPNTIRTLLNSQIQIYLPIRIKMVEGIFKWLSKEDLGTYYLREKNPDDDDKYWDRYYAIEFEEMEAVLGFTALVQYYNVYETILGRECYLGYDTSVSTSWDKTEDDKTQKKTHNITGNSRIEHKGIVKRVLKGSEVRLQWISFYTKVNFAINAENPYFLFEGISKSFAKWEVIESYAKQDLYYECEYDMYIYGGKEVHIYHYVNEITNYKECMSESEYKYGEKLNLTEANPKLYNRTQYIWEVRGQLDNVSMRFRNRTCNALHTGTMLFNEELCKVSRPYITDYAKNEYVFESLDQMLQIIQPLQAFLNYDRKIQFMDTRGGGIGTYGIGIAQNMQKDFIQTTVFHNSEHNMTYFGINAFLNPRMNVTFL